MSVLLHLTIILVSVMGLPYLQRTPAKEDIPMVVELIPIATKTNIPNPAVNKPKPVPPEPEPPLPTASKSKTKEKNEPKLIKVAKKSIKTPMPEKAVKVNLKPKIKPKLVAPKKLARVSPARKPIPPDPFALVLKNLENEIKKTQTPKKNTKKEKRKNVNFESKIAKVLSSRSIDDSPSSQITISEMHAMINTIRTAIMPCWNLQPGAKGAQDIVVIIGASLNPDGRVAHAWVKNRNHLIQDPFKLAAAETAQRAILNQACQPFKLDPTKYDIWKDVTLNFNPSEMFGK